MVNESNLVMAICCEAGEPLRYINKQKVIQGLIQCVFFVARNIVLTPLLQNLELKLYYVV